MIDVAKIRTGRVGEQLKKEISALIQTELKDPRIGFVTIVDVDVTGDLSQAKVYFTVLGNEEQQQQCIHALHKATGFLRSEIGKRIRLRHVPELIFKMDTSTEYGSRIQHLLSELKSDPTV